MRTVEQLFNLIPKLETIEFVGLAHLLGVKLMEETAPEAEDIKDRYSARSFTAVLNDMLAKFETLNRKRQREILQMVKSTINARGDKNGSNS